MFEFFLLLSIAAHCTADANGGVFQEDCADNGSNAQHQGRGGERG